MYIAGLHLTLGNPQLVDGIIVTSAMLQTLATIYPVPTFLVGAESKDTSFQPHSGSQTFNLERRISHLLTGITNLITGPIRWSLYGVSLLNGFHQPEWLQTHFSFPLTSYTTPLRFCGCILDWFILFGFNYVLFFLRDQLPHNTARPHLVSEGPYSFIRHPLYSLILLQLLITSLSLWSKFPLYLFGIALADIMVKIHFEEKLILQDDSTIAADYKEYKKVVKYQLIPYIW